MLALSASVGRRGHNDPADVARVQMSLRRAAEITLDDRLHPGPADGLSGDGTEGAIDRFQRRIGLRPDGRIDPGGTTARRLVALLEIGDDLADGKISFPFERSSRYPYLGDGAGMRAFGADRDSGKRAHAGIDLYFPDFTPVLAMADGVVTRGPYPFYLKTFAVEVDHGSFIARYGELAPEAGAFVAVGSRVTKGQQLGRVGVLIKSNGKRLGVPSMMLHLEMFDKTSTGPLTAGASTSARHTNGALFYRRRDLIDPTGIAFGAPLPTNYGRG